MILIPSSSRPSENTSQSVFELICKKKSCTMLAFRFLGSGTCRSALTAQSGCLIRRSFITSAPLLKAERPKDFRGARRRTIRSDLDVGASDRPLKASGGLTYRYPRKKLLRIGLFIFVLATGVAAFWLVVRTKLLKSGERLTDDVNEDFRRRVFQVMAPAYNEKVISGERWIGIRRLRQNLLVHARGDVLEVAAGTGTNFELYDRRKVTSVHALDLSANMVAQARLDATALGVKAIEVGNAEDLSRFADGSFDTVVDTFGLCSFERPEVALAEMTRVLKDDGVLLLLEHGRCARTYRWLRRLLDNNAERHAEHFGCWWNRDMVRLVDAAGLEMPYFRMRHLRTTFFIIAKKKKNSNDQQQQQQQQQEQEPQKQ